MELIVLIKLVVKNVTLNCYCCCIAFAVFVLRCSVHLPIFL